MVSEASTCTAAREVSSVVAASRSRQQGTAVCGVRHNFPKFIQWSGNRRTILRQSKHEIIGQQLKHTHIKKQIYICRNSLYGPARCVRTKGDASDMAIAQPTRRPHPSPPGSTTSERMRPYPPCVFLPDYSVSQATVTAALEG